MGASTAHLHMVPSRADLRSQPSRAGLLGAKPTEGGHERQRVVIGSERAKVEDREVANLCLPVSFPVLLRPGAALVDWPAHLGE